MMLAASALSAVAAAATQVFSPSRNGCIKRVGPSRFRYDPYSSHVVTASYVSTPVSLKPLASPTVAPPATTRTQAASIPATSSITAPMPMTPAQQHVEVSLPASSTRYAVIKFKQETATFIAPFRIFCGDTVVVEGDRGENIGIVHEITQVKPTFHVTSRVIRRATDKDMEALQAQRERELAAMKMTQSLASSLGLHAVIEDVEYQFDLNKLTIYVRRSAKNAFVDFRKLQRGLFREFRCRIWCAYMDEVEEIEQGPRTR